MVPAATEATLLETDKPLDGVTESAAAELISTGNFLSEKYTFVIYLICSNALEQPIKRTVLLDNATDPDGEYIELTVNTEEISTTTNVIDATAFVYPPNDTETVVLPNGVVESVLIVLPDKLNNDGTLNTVLESELKSFVEPSE